MYIAPHIISTINIYDNNGQPIKNIQVHDNQVEIILYNLKGIYVMELYFENSVDRIYRKVILV